MPRKLATSKAYREQRTAKCMGYLREAGNLPDARKLANERDGFQANTSAWIAAIGRILRDVKVPNQD